MEVDEDMNFEEGNNADSPEKEPGWLMVLVRTFLHPGKRGSSSAAA
jgi:hypothetical protein